MAGRLVLVATPIGNLGDLSSRAIEALRAADVVACEDTRRTGLLLQRAGIERTRLLRADEHTERAASAEVVRLLDQGAVVAVVTDAGTPGISDPGAVLVRGALAAGHEVTCVPGPVAAVAALVVSGLPTERWVMEGFLPRSGALRTERLAEVASERRTVVLYEAPHRLVRTITDLTLRCGEDRPVVLARELTKLYEQVWRGTLGEASALTTEPRGEYVIVLGGAPAPDSPTTEAIEVALLASMSRGATRKDAATEVATAFGLPRNRVYDAALRLER